MFNNTAGGHSNLVFTDSLIALNMYWYLQLLNFDLPLTGSYPMEYSTPLQNTLFLIPHTILPQMLTYCHKPAVRKLLTLQH